MFPVFVRFPDVLYVASNNTFSHQCHSVGTIPLPSFRCCDIPLPAQPKDEIDEKARYTIDILNLNDEKLCAARESALWEADVFSTKTKEEYLQLIEKYSSPASGKLTEFCDAILLYLRKGLEECD